MSFSARAEGCKTRIEAPLKELPDQVAVTLIGEEIALFTAKANLSARVGCNARSIGLLRRAVAAGSRHCENCNGTTPMRTMADRTIPNISPVDAGKAIKQMGKKSKTD
jgi:hypothetical protein